MLKIHLIFIGLTIASCQGFLWYQGDSSSETTTQSPPAPSRVQTYPITYIRAFAYHPVAFPQPLAPITTYNVRNTPPSQKSGFQTSRGVGGFVPNYQKLDTPSSYSLPSHQQPPQNLKSDFGTVPTTSSTTTTTTPATTTTTTTTTPSPTPAPQSSSFVPSQQIPLSNGEPWKFHGMRSGGDGYQRQLYYGGSNFGGFPSFYNNPYNPYPYVDQNIGNQFTGRYSSGEPSYQQYTTDSVTYQFIPTSITPMQSQMQSQNSVKFVPCMCPVAVSLSPPIPEKRSDEVPIVQVAAKQQQQSSSETETQPLTSSTKALDELEIDESK